MLAFKKPYPASDTYDYRKIQTANYQTVWNFKIIFEHKHLDTIAF